MTAGTRPLQHRRAGVLAQRLADQTFAAWQKADARLSILQQWRAQLSPRQGARSASLLLEVGRLRLITQDLYEVAACAHRDNRARHRGPRTGAGPGGLPEGARS